MMPTLKNRGSWPPSIRRGDSVATLKSCLHARGNSTAICSCRRSRKRSTITPSMRWDTGSISGVDRTAQGASTHENDHSLAVFWSAHPPAEAWQISTPHQRTCRHQADERHASQMKCGRAGNITEVGNQGRLDESSPCLRTAPLYSATEETPGLAASAPVKVASGPFVDSQSTPRPL